MKNRISDFLLIVVIFAFPLFGILQSCSLNGGATAPDDNNPPVPVGKITGSNNGPSPLEVEFDASGSHDPDNDQIEYVWYFSDGTYEAGAKVTHTFTGSGRHSAILSVKDEWGATSESDPVYAYVWGLANSPWPKFAHDERNSCVSPNRGPMMDLTNASEGGAFPRYWRGDYQDELITGIVVGYDGVVYYTQGDRLHARMSDGGYLWDYVTDSEITSWPAIIHDGSIVFTTRSAVYCLNPEREIVWEFTGSEYHNFGPVVSVTADVILIPWQDKQLGFGRGWLQAFNFDGSESWKFPIDNVAHGYTASRTTGIFPSVLPDGNIVLNGEEPWILTRYGGVANKIMYDSSSGYPLGVPSISQDGLIAFAYPEVFIYNSSGELQVTLFEDDSKLSKFEVPSLWDDNYLTIPAVDDRFVESIRQSDYLLRTVVLNGGFSDLSTFYDEGLWMAISKQYGACEDVNGRIYVSNYGLHAVSRVSIDNSSPPLPKRYSLWSYSRDTWTMTSPVIGEDGWMYLGYGTDIMAIGD